MTHEIKLMTEKEKMLAGLIYSAVDEELLKELNEVKDIIHKYNSLLPSASQERFAILKGLLGHTADDEFIINPAILLRLWKTDQHRKAILCEL